MKTDQFIKREWIGITFLIIPFVMLIYLWNDLPEKIPVHWNIEGEVDRYAGKGFELFLLPLINVFTYLVISISYYIDPKNKLKFSLNTLTILKTVIAGFVTMLFSVMLAISLGFPINMPDVVQYGIILLFLVIGNYLSKIRPNYFMGIRTPWTLENEEVWKKTHRLGGKIWVSGSVILLITKIILANHLPFPLFLGFIVAMSLIPVIYSYITFKQLEKKSA
ncbi:SdpI family protein [Flexithrix dorotheae]|uniref:SdpI family protein n=1 Tax=Flexithrix dorotheae TaxID=70993 RepID=UPI000363FDB5|nr:SdpI family protein [Flexithrix dorotheae]